MDEIIKLLHKEMALHPKMEAQDAVKFVYQAVFGGGHLISDEKSALSRLKAEYEAADIDSSVPVYDVLSSKYVRVNIAAVKGRLSPETLCRIFVLSSADHHDGVDKFKALASLAAEEYGAEGRKYLSSYIKSGINPVSHSLSYKAA